jgi:vancomycin resistance protein YoaR
MKPTFNYRLHAEQGLGGNVMPDQSQEKYGRHAKKGAHGKAIAITMAAIAVCVGVIATGFVRYSQERSHLDEVSAALDTDRFYEGISVQGVSLGGMTMEQAKEAVKQQEASANGEYSITVVYGEKTWTLTQKDMTFSYDADEVLKKAYAVGRTGDREERYKIIQELKTKPQSFSLTATPVESTLKAKVDEIPAQVNRKAVEPSVASFSPSSGFTFKDGTAGLSVDEAQLWNDVKAVVEGSRAGTVQLKVSAVPFTKTVADLKKNMKKLGTFSTVSVNSEDGTYNMEKALLTANGTNIPAGGTFSFLGTVGSCDKAHGYRVAGVLVNGKHDVDYGGGVCQASTTIYGAALRSGMQIVERNNHAIPSAYCKIGQDATVSYPYLDMKVKNTTDYPMFLVTSTKGRTLTATFYGYQPSSYDSIEIVSQIDKTYAPPTTPKYTLDSSLAAGVVRLDQRARTGYKASARRIYYKNGAAVKTEYLNSSYYPAQPAYYSYGKGTNISPAGGKAPSGSASSSASSSPSSSASSKPSSSKPSSSNLPSSQMPSSNASDSSSSSSDAA